MAELVVYAELGDGYLTKSNLVFATSHDALNADSVDVASDEAAVGISKAIIPPQWSFLRPVLPFDTSPLPPGVGILAAVLSLRGWASSYMALDPPILIVVDGSDCAAALVVADYGVLLGKIVSGGSIAIPDFNTAGWNHITLNAIGRGWTNPGGITKLALRTDFDIDSHAESGNAGFFTADKGVGFKPYLTITYSLLPTVTTNPATLVSRVGAKLNGVLNSDGGDACDVRFQWGETIAYGNDTAWQSGKNTGAIFEQAIGGLVLNTTYHFRAQARNTGGTANGADRSFTTTQPFNRAHALSREEM